MREAESVRPADGSLDLRLHILDPEVVAELAKLPEGTEREAHAIRALRIGLLAMRQAAGAIDVDAVRREGDQILTKLKMQLNGHQAHLHDQLERTLREYFDPQSGRFAERVESLLKKDGELENVLRAQVGGEGSLLQSTLSEHFGPDSALMRTLSPSESEGLLKSMEGVLGEALREQRTKILGQFSLDDDASALARLVKDLKANHDDISKTLEQRVGDVVGEFSLDNRDSALSKLVARVDEAQARISAEFSLDQESSALARMKREMLDVFDRGAKENQEFRETVLRQLGEMNVRQQEREKSTRHGDDFEASFFDLVQARAQAAGDIPELTNNTTGAVRHSKKGDVVVELGPEHAAAGARIVYEAKQDASYTLAKARDEIDAARQNRKAQVGVFVFSRRTAPEGLAAFQRIGDDLFVVWDEGDPQTDVWLDAASEVARALCVAGTSADEANAEDIEALEKAINDIAQQSGLLDEITTWSKTIGSNVVKIQERVRKSRKDFERQVLRLQDVLRGLRGG